MTVDSKLNIPTVRELLTSLKNIREEWKLKTPSQKWCIFYGIGRAGFGIASIPLFNDINYLHWSGLVLLGYLTVVICLSIYTLTFYGLHGHPELGLASTTFAALCIGHYPSAMLVTLKGRYKLQPLLDFGGLYIYQDNHEKTEYNRICSEQIDGTVRDYFNKFVTIIFSFCIASTSSIVLYFFTGIRSTTVEAHVPGLEPKSDAEYYSCLAFQCATSVHGFFCYVGLEAFLSMLANVVMISPQLIISELKNTIELWDKNTISEAVLNRMLGNIVQQSADLDEYIGTASKLLYWRNLFTTSAFTYLIGIGIFCQYTLEYTAGYGMAIMSWTQLFYVCELGENIQDNGFVDMLYETRWENLPRKYQRVVVLLLHRKQNEPGLKLGPFGVGINRETFKLSTNRCYTLVMFLKNFFE